MSRKATAALAWAGFVVLIALHLDFWRPQEARVVLGWVPEDLAYRLGWCAVAWLYLLWFCAKVWRSPDAEPRTEED